MLTGTSSVGVDFQRSTSISGSYSAFGTVLAVKPPKIMNSALEMTPLNSTSPEFIKERLIRKEPFDVVMTMDSSMLETAYDDLAADGSNWYRVIFPAIASKTNWQFEALLTAIDVPQIAENSPAVLKATLTFQPTGAMTGLT